MALPNVNIKIQNGGLGRIALTADGVAGMILTGTPVAGKLELNQVYSLSSTRDLNPLGVTEATNPLIHKEVTAFYTQAGDGAELYLLVVSQTTTLTQMCAAEAESALHQLINFAKGRIRMVGINRLPAADYEAVTVETGVDGDVVTAVAAAHAVAESYAGQVNPFRMLLPGMLWDGKTEKLYRPRESSYNRVGIVLAADVKVGTHYSAAIGQVLGRAALVPVNYSLGRVKSGAIAATGWLTNGKTPQECTAILDTLDDAGYLFYRSYTGRNGYYLNGDAMAAPMADDYSNLNLGRVIDKVVLLTYGAYIDEILDSIEVDSEGKIPVPLCTYYQSKIENIVMATMQEQISSFTAVVEPAQNVLSTGILTVVCKIVPKGTLREINVSLGFENPTLK